MERHRTPQQAAAIPVRRTRKTLDVCLIRKKDSGDWGIPKGTIDPGNTPEATALIEADEEAGLEGRLIGPAIGMYRYKKWYVRLLVVVYVLEVLEEHAEWEEDWIRERRWTPFEKATSLLLDHPVRPLLERAECLAADSLRP